jgi:prepilin-type N-terminal cleavage/methylation domain-containing protein
MSLRANPSGFTMIELIVVVTILGLLASVVVPNLDGISPKYRLRSAARTIGQNIGWARSLGGGVGDEYVLRYDLGESTFSIILPPGIDEDPDLDVDMRETMGVQTLPEGIVISKILHPDGMSDEYGIVDIVLDEYGTTGSHIAVVRNEEDTTIAVYFEAIIGSIQYMPGEDAEFPRW